MARACTDSIVDLIASLRLGEGDRLPGERELAKHLGYSRTTVRESLIALAAEGRVEIRGRSGCYVGTRATDDERDALRLDAASALDALRAIGPHIAARAAHHCTGEDARRLETVTARLGRFLVNRDAPQTAREYVTFFVVLAGVAANPYLALLVKEIAQVHGLPGRPAALDKTSVESFFALHVSLIQAVQNRDARRAVPLAAHGLDAFTAMMGGIEAKEHVA